MACNPDTLRQVPLFALLDDEETAVLASQVDLQKFAPRQRIYKAGDAGGRGYIVVSGAVRVTTVDEDQQEVVVDEPSVGEFFGFHLGKIGSSAHVARTSSTLPCSPLTSRPMRLGRLMKSPCSITNLQTPSTGSTPAP